MCEEKVIQQRISNDVARLLIGSSSAKTRKMNLEKVIQQGLSNNVARQMLSFWRATFLRKRPKKYESVCLQRGSLPVV
jgi:hypothetical protein